MKNSFTMLVGGAIFLALLAYTFLYQVRYDQVAVRTTFDKADAASVQSTPGLKWRLPWPIHKVTHYSKRLQLLEDKLEELQTADGKSVIVRTYLTWRIENPLDFYVTLKDPAEAARQLSSRLREIRGIISRYRLDELVNIDPARLKLTTIEDEAKAALEQSLAASGYGLKVESVGIYKIVLPEATTEKIFETMIKTRERLAENALQEGQAQASAIRSEATSARDRILAFAERRAQTIRSQGDREAAKEYESFAKNEDFAIFLRKVEALKKMLDHNTTFVLSADSLGILDWFNRAPGQDGPPVARPAGAAAAEGMRR
jgi:membrane protease subunit HflC